MRLTVDVRHRFGAFALDARFVGDTGLTALFGRSGSGKTSLVNVIAGLVRPEEGRVTVDGRVLVDTKAGVFVPRHRRRIGYVFQEARLFPHLSVRANLLYGRWFTRARQRGGNRARVVARRGGGPLLGRRPTGLSGGERQRVAIGRALLASPQILLMDEPLASLDHARKAEILPYIERLRDEAELPIVYVSHSLDEVARLAGTVVLLADGRVQAAGPTAEVLTRMDLGAMVGAEEAGSVLDAEVRGRDLAFGLSTLRSKAGNLTVPATGLRLGTRVRVRIRARDVMLATRRPESISALNVLEGTVSAVGEPQGAAVDVRIDCGGAPLVARITRRSLEVLGLRPGTPVYAIVKSVAFDAGGH